MGNTRQVMFYNRLRQLRNEHSVSRQALADACNIHVQTVGYIERRQYNLSLELAFKLSSFFNQTVSNVFALEPFDDQ